MSQDRINQELTAQIEALKARLDRLRLPEIPLSSVTGAVVASYNTSTAQSIPNDGTVPSVINYSTVERDPYSAVTTGAAWKFTAPVAGDYGVAAAIIYSSTTTWATGEVASLELWKQGNIYRFLDRKDSINSNLVAIFTQVSGASTVYLNAGEYIDLRTRQTSGAALTLFNNAMYNYVSIWKI